MRMIKGGIKQPERILSVCGAIAVCLTWLLVDPQVAGGQTIDQVRGADPTVEYELLRAFGPWDDRNYQLTQADLDLLSPEEDQLRDPIPSFFRVLLRRDNPNLPREGPAQYPRSALQIFLSQCGGYLVNGMLYTQAAVVDGHFVVTEEGGTPYQAADYPACRVRS